MTTYANVMAFTQQLAYLNVTRTRIQDGIFSVYTNVPHLDTLLGLKHYFQTYIFDRTKNENAETARTNRTIRRRQTESPCQHDYLLDKHNATNDECFKII